jgi:hypothetical protein
MLFNYTRMKPAIGGSKNFLYFAGVFNFVAALILVVLARLAPDVIGLDPVTRSQMLFVDLSAWLVGFGIGYVLGGFDLTRFWPFIALGAVGKAGVVLLVTPYFLLGATGPLIALLVVGDGIFAFLFVRLLRAHAAH